MGYLWKLDTQRHRFLAVVRSYLPESITQLYDSFIYYSETNRTGPYTSSIDAVAFASSTKLTGNKELLSQWLESIDTQFYASNPSPGRKAVYEIERQRLMWNDKSATIEYVSPSCRNARDAEASACYRVYCAPALSFPQFFEPNTSYVQVASIQSHPFSRGSIHLNTSDPLVPPLIELNAWAFDIGKPDHFPSHNSS